MPKETSLTRPLDPMPPENTPSWRRRLLLAGGIACLAIALIGFVVFALRAVSIA